MLPKSLTYGNKSLNLLLFAVVFLSTGCVAPTPVAPSSLECADLKLDKFVSAIEQTTYESDSFSEWLSREFGVGKSTIHRSQERTAEGNDTADVFEWQGSRQRLRLEVVGGKPVALFGGWVQDPPTVAQVIECLGEPAAYVAAFHDEPVLERPVVGFRMFYPPIGTVISAFIPVDQPEGETTGTAFSGISLNASDATANDITILTKSTTSEDLLDSWLRRRMSTNNEETDKARSAYYHASLGCVDTFLQFWRHPR